ncbi:MAG: class I SAM-dependent methyltransferase [Deltaproteobacteria bacterium]|nr:class I SAM-dependent methyltransferase [Deltaproteobacteria bacterium]
MNSPWPDGFARIPDADWVSEKIDTLARKYDSVEHHGWYRNLDPTVDRLRELVTDGDIVIDYSGGTGILTDRLLRACPDLNAGWLIVDSSPKFLRLALEKLRDETRVAFRLIRYLKPERRLQLLDEVLGAEPASVHGLVSTNAVHLYYDLPETVASWVRVLRPNGGFSSTGPASTTTSGAPSTRRCATSTSCPCDRWTPTSAFFATRASRWKR